MSPFSRLTNLVRAIAIIHRTPDIVDIATKSTFLVTYGGHVRHQIRCTQTRTAKAWNVPTKPRTQKSTTERGSQDSETGAPASSASGMMRTLTVRACCTHPSCLTQENRVTACNQQGAGATHGSIYTHLFPFDICLEHINNSFRFFRCRYMLRRSRESLFWRAWVQ